ncbi:MULTISPECIES: glycoside hydrolase family 99-like domain-containing protein [Roseateles]|uniref:Lipopolysaccharide biosynthesis protein n=1 Tax=Pelomonas aquatica TaxID=431058 RepID=A0ABU1Z3G0_9BURK|nr:MULTISPECIES: glycoside hydrolase family 99-like domain-containing protein [Roseateles]KQY81394.1 lipopolysaccharide biosynthesis protein [Pelomonas sp. Root1444]MDR7295152.1 lipopolysaccharide biosynthesis protein [Pelomonas aquatica]
MKPEVIALYLPQYHPIKENDEWWEPGFTEWTNVTKAKPLYRGHHQPNLPSELGLYDLRVPEAREAQAELAKAYSVTAFCYYHYWFGNGRRLLERPLNDVLACGKPDFPFMVCWANQTWSGAWHGLDKQVLAEQLYPGVDDEKAHFETLLSAFRDPRYLRVKGKPVFMVYAPDDLPDPVAFIAHWRRLAEEAGLPGLYVLAEHRDPFWDARAHGFDAFILKPSFMRRRAWTPWSQPLQKIRNRILDALGRPSVFDYEAMQPYLLPERASPQAIPCVLPNWDNTPRSGARGVVLENSTPQKFGAALDRALALWRGRDREDNFLFVKSWNEWAEGNHLEPNRRWGRAYLEVLAAKINASR